MKKELKIIIILKLLILTLLIQSCKNKTEEQKQTTKLKNVEIGNDSVSKNVQQTETEQNDKIILGEDISEINAYAKKIYEIKGIIYVDLDLVEFSYPTQGEYDKSDRKIINNNPKIRTYEIDKKTSILSNNCKNLSDTELLKMQKSILKVKSIIVIGRSKNGKILEINFGCYG